MLPATRHSQWAACDTLVSCFCQLIPMCRLCFVFLHDICWLCDRDVLILESTFWLLFQLQFVSTFHHILLTIFLFVRPARLDVGLALTSFLWFLLAFYRVAQNKLDCLLLLSQVLYFYNKTRKYDNVYMQHQKRYSKRCSVCPPPVATTSDSRLQKCLIAWSITSLPICSQ